jgi:hypothetical protein
MMHWLLRRELRVAREVTHRKPRKCLCGIQTIERPCDEEEFTRGVLGVADAAEKQAGDGERRFPIFHRILDLNF